MPPLAIRQLRDLTRHRKRLIQAHTSECPPIQKTLEDGGIKLDSVASDVLGVSGRAMLAALIAGERDPQVLARLAKGRLRRKIPALRQALRGQVTDHHALLIGLCLDHTRPPRSGDRPARRARRVPGRHPDRGGRSPVRPGP